MVRPSNQRAYSVATGTSQIGAPVQEARDPTTLDVNYTLYQTWQNTSTDIMWQLVSFTSTSGTVLANWVQFATSATDILTITGDSGGAVGPTAGNVNVLGTAGQITVTGNPGTSTLTLALAGGGTAIDSITVDAATPPGTNPVISNGAGLIAITGAQVASGTVGANVIRTDSLAANSLTVEVQRSTAVAATDSTKNGVSHFNSSMFSVDAGGFVSLSGGGQAIDSFIPDSGTNPVVPAADGSVTMAGSGSITTVGGLNSLTTELTGLTNHAVLVGAGTTTITKVGPSATTGAPLISGGAAADPGFSTTFTISDSGFIASETATLVGGVVQLGVRNNDNTNASSGARLDITAGGSSAGDVYTLYDANVAGKNYETGLQQSSSKYLINYSANTGTATLSGTTLVSVDGTNNGNTVFTPTGTGQVIVGTGTPTAEVAPDRIPFSVAQSVVGGTLAGEIFNTDNTSGSSRANLTMRVGGTSAGDAVASWVINGGSSWSAGADNSDSDNWVLSSGLSLGVNNIIKATSAGAITFNSAFTFPTTDGTAGQVLTTNGAGTVTWSNSGVGAWTDTSGIFTASRNSAYFLTAASTATLPASPVQGDTVDFVCDTAGSCVITANAGQSIRIANQLSSVAGTATNSARGDTLSLVYRAAATTWFAFEAPNGGWTTA